MYYGADYYPEHWPKERWEQDAKLMKAAGMNLIRVAEFAWAKLEPSEGVYDFDWLDRALDLFYRHGIRAVIGTPTATPPKWLMDRHPDIYKRDENGLVLGFGSRRHYCYNNETYREYSAKITEQVVRHYAGYPALAAWQIDNEFTAGDGLYCYCDSCRAKFVRWLKERYGSLGAVNEAWGTVFWSQTYTDWDQIVIPRRAQASKPRNNGHNPGLNLDFSRFQSDGIVEYCRIQSRIIRRHSDKPVTHNIVHEELDYYKLGEELDICTYDNYPRLLRGEENEWESYDPAFAADIERGAKNKNIWIMEEQSGPCGWEVLGSTPRPGQIRQWAMQAMAHGAESIVYFRWRACTFGTEEYWYGILDHDGIPRRRYDEVKALGLDFPELARYNDGSRIASEVLLIRSFEQQWSHHFQSHNWNFDYRKYIRSLYAGLYKNNINVDISGEHVDLSRYRLVLAPAFNLMDDARKAKFEEYVKNGGNLVLTFRSGTKEMDNRMTERTLPGYFKDVAGIELEEFDSLYRRAARVKGAFGEGEASVWADIIKPGGNAEVVAAYESEYYAGKPAITVNRYGEGRCYYVGCDLDDKATQALMAHIAGECGVRPAIAGLPAEVEAVKKQTADGRDFYFLFNFADGPQTVRLPFEATDAATGNRLGTSFEMPRYGGYLIV